MSGTAPRWGWTGWAAAVAAVAGTYLTPLPDAVRSAVFGLVGLGVVALATVTVARRRPRPPLSWSLIPVSLGLFLLGAALRPWADGRPGVQAFAPDPFSICGYVLLAVALARLASSAGGLRREVVYDVLIASLAAAAAAVQFLVLPVLELPGRTVAGSVLAGVYPLLDVVVVVLGLDLLLIAPGVLAHRWLGAALAFLLVGDLGYAVLGRWGWFVAPTAFDAPFVVACCLLGVAVLHLPPRGRTAPPSRTFDAWSPARLVVLCVSLTGAAYLASTRGGQDRAGQVAAFAVLCTTIGLVVARAVSAVNGQASAKAVLEHRATHDGLTDLLDRDEFERRVEVAAPGVRRFLLFVDLDGFKRVNDTHGHVVGDALLREVADRLRRLAPDGAVIGRLAGDEFVVVVEGGQDTATDLAQELLGGLRAPLRLRVGEVVVSASIGVAEVARSVATALREADVAMYRAKSHGRNQFVVWDDSLRREIGDEVEFELDLRSAVAEQTLQVHYQAIVSLATGEPRGVEALLRWTHPLHGPVPPTRFVPVLEETGLVVDVGRWVLGTALDDLARWRREGVVGTDFLVSVNVSPRQLLDPFFARTVAERLAASGVEGGALLLEITESSMLEKDDQTLHLLAGLRALGVGLAVDDFGTGYSALGYLRSFPVTRVKIDRSFVAGLDQHAADLAVVRAVVAVGEALDLAVTAEGVETEEQRAALRELGVAHGQGWLWHRAQSATDVARYLAAGTAGRQTRLKS
ncbi:EAL domain-containing protein [Kineococcus aurantiacus]|uniref:Diguanylate cyclase (GGDEF)-like protein n=1 Tax=Kineococcus aurantiacus TaxID=37633 RepID=A0A7Y9AU98_9ACTN|nr:diguanylate cyclase (GGDEF)-like protein [Kineococcus aurantiacus]